MYKPTILLAALSIFGFTASGMPVTETKRETAGEACPWPSFSYFGSDDQCWTCDANGILQGPNATPDPCIIIFGKRAPAEETKMVKRTQAGDPCDSGDPNGPIPRWLDSSLNCWQCGVYGVVEGPFPASQCGLIF